MLVNDVILEKHYKGPLYHVTIISFATRILKDQEIIFSNSQESEIEAKYRSGRRPDNIYYLSTSRSKLNSFRNLESIELYKQATFVIDPNKLTQEMAFSQVNYWGDKYASYPKGHESEERIWSKKQAHPIDFIAETHILQKDLELIMVKKEAIEVADLSEKKNNIPCYIYSDVKQYAVLNKRKAYRAKDLRNENT